MKALNNAKANKLIARWIYIKKYGTRVPIYTQYNRRHDEPRLKEKPTPGSRYKATKKSKEPDVFSSIERLEKKAAEVDLDNVTIEKAYREALKAYDKNKKAIDRLHKVYEQEQIKKLKQAQYRLDRIMFQLKQRSNED